MTKAEEKARFLIACRTMKQLIEDFEMTETNNDQYIYIVRGWIMDELEKRDPEAFDKWIDSNEENPKEFFKEVKK